MEQQVRYCTAEDGVRIAYSVEGEGPPLFFVHYTYAFTLSHLVPKYHEALRRIGRGRQLIRYDMRGTGLSQHDADDLSPAADIRDMEAVVRTLELDDFILFGASSSGGPRAIEYAARHPDQVSGLILYEAVTKLLDVFPRELIQMFAGLARANWQTATRSLSDIATRTERPEDQLQWMEMTGNSTTGELMARIVEAKIDMDVNGLLAQIECPTLVLHSRHNMQWPFWCGQRIAEGIPNARLIPLEGGGGGAFTDPDSALDAIDSFLHELQPEVTMPAGVDGASAIKRLTPREAEILQLIAAGATSKEISHQLSLSIRTVGRHITNIYDKIGARGRADATSFALRHRLIEE